MSVFRQFLSESKGQLDISIQAAGKYLTSAKRISEFLRTPVVVEQKLDGVKLTIIKKSESEFIVAYKGNILYSEEYDYQSTAKVKSESIGASQFKLVFKHLAKLKDTSGIPVGTELFVEYLMNKPTLSSNYSDQHKMVLIGHTESTWTEDFGKLKTNPNAFKTDKRDEFAKIMKIDVPQKLFDGTFIDFENGIINKTLASEYRKVKNSFNFDNEELLLDDIRLLFLSIESKYGGVEEGVVMITRDRLLKFTQEYQIDPAARLKIKMKYRQENPEVETQYWDNVKAAAHEIASGISVNSKKLNIVLTELSLILKKYVIKFDNDKKTPAIIKDDIQLNAKNLLIKSMKGNNNALILGKFRVLTNDGHVKLIKSALKEFDNVVICIVTSKDTKHSKALREEMIRKTFPKVKIMHSLNGNVIRLIQKSPININAIYAGSDRVVDYQKQLRNNVGVSVKEMVRTSSGISATEVLSKIEDIKFFKRNTPKAIHDMWKEIKESNE